MSDNTSIIQATHGSPDRPLVVGEFEIPCYVLADRRRVLVQGGIMRTLNLSPGGSNSRGGDRLAKFTAQKTLEPFVSGELLMRTAHPIKFRTPMGTVAYGYEATVLADLVKVVIRARDEGKLSKQQQHIADRCVILRDGLVGVAIIALVDERTGYQEERNRDELQKILAAYISPDLLPWTRRFPPEFYEQMFRLWGWQYYPPATSKNKRPPMAGKLTVEWVYNKLPPGVLEELRKRNPADETGQRKHKHHQLLSEDIGNPHLEKQVLVVTTLLRISRTKRDFQRNFALAFPAPATQLVLFPDEEDNESNAKNQND